MTKTFGFKNFIGKECKVSLNALSRQATEEILPSQGASFTARIAAVEPGQGIWIKPPTGARVPKALGGSEIFIPFSAISAVFVAERGFAREKL